jgi:hypothetical protein
VLDDDRPPESDVCSLKEEQFTEQVNKSVQGDVFGQKRGLFPRNIGSKMTKSGRFPTFRAISGHFGPFWTPRNRLRTPPESSKTARNRRFWASWTVQNSPKSRTSSGPHFFGVYNRKYMSKPSPQGLADPPPDPSFSTIKSTFAPGPESRRFRTFPRSGQSRPKSGIWVEK